MPYRRALCSSLHTRRYDATELPVSVERGNALCDSTRGVGGLLKPHRAPLPRMCEQGGDMHDDPVVFALKDNVSRWVGLLFVMSFVAAI